MTALATQPKGDLAKMAGPRLPYIPQVEERFGIDRSGWKALVEAIFPAAQSPESVILALSYCKARRLDPFKRVVHIVPIWDKQQGKLVDTVWPGIGELRTTAFRTGEYAGRDDAKFGPTVTEKVGKVDCTYPEWCQVTVYRMIKGHRVAFAGPHVYWRETYATNRRDDDSPNSMWKSRPRGQIEKCAEAAALRAAFPEEIGNDYIPEEAEGFGANRGTEIVEQAPTKQSVEDKLKALDEPSQPTASDFETPEVIDPPPAEEPLEGMDENDVDAALKTVDPGTAPEHWINEEIRLNKPAHLTAGQARKLFNAADVEGWDALTPERRRQKYAELKAGKIKGFEPKGQ